MRYRPEVDGLRAVAVLPVILFHAGFASFSGGFVGVDVFFVISGYLIAGIIWAEAREDRFSLLRFYERRVRRILPALFVVSLACLPFAWLWMMPSELQAFARSLTAVNLFASNVLFWHESGYFDPAVELKPLLHTWSLAVEEQFYLFFPLLLLALRRLRTRRVAALTAGLSLLSFLLAEILSRTAPSAAFYLLPARAWELGVGAVLALLTMQETPPRLSAPLRAALGLGGLASILASVLLLSEADPFPGVHALPPVLGAAAVLLGAGPDNLAGRLLSLRPVVGIGLISYSVYLWHQPIFAFARIRSLDGLSGGAWLLLAAASIGLGWLSWRFVERPFRRPGTVSRRAVMGGAAAVASLLIVMGVAGDAADGFPGRLDPETRRLVATRAISPMRAECHNKRGRDPAQACLYGGDAAGPAVAPDGDSQGAVWGDGHKVVAVWGDSHEVVAVWGDSHGVELAWGLARAGARVRQLTYSVCPPAVGLEIAGADEPGPGCDAINRRVLAWLESAPEVRDVVLVARWTLYLEGERFDNGEGGHEFGGPVRAYPLPPAPGRVTETGAPAPGQATGSDDPAGSRVEGVAAGFAGVVSRLRAAGKRVTLVYPVPEAGWSVPERLARLHLFRGPSDVPLTTSRAVFEARTARIRAVFDALPDGPDLIRIRPAEAVFCGPGAPPGRCLAELDGEPLYFDDNHPSLPAAGRLADRIASALGTFAASPAPEPDAPAALPPTLPHALR